MNIRPEASQPAAPLPVANRRVSDPQPEPLEAAFGVEFTEVRIHTDAVSAAAADQMAARAYSAGDNDLGFDPEQGQVRFGKPLVAHELTHGVQQRGGIPEVTRLAPSEPNL
jgi:hypothetical protein